MLGAVRAWVVASRAACLTTHPERCVCVCAPASQQANRMVYTPIHELAGRMRDAALLFAV